GAPAGGGQSGGWAPRPAADGFESQPRPAARPAAAPAAAPATSASIDTLDEDVPF
ncbi:hypothetical protein HMPREF9440_00150, partial [Sutterella parvirubra YIT 11816]